MHDADRRRFLRMGALFGGAALLAPGAIGRAAAAEQGMLTLYNSQHAKTTAALVDAFTKRA